MTGEKRGCSGVAAALAVLATAAPATAQDGWDVETDTERDITVASVIYEGGVGIAVQCSDDDLDFVVLGVPAPDESEISDYGHRVLDTGTSADSLVTSSWKAVAGSPGATSVYPDRFARSLKGAEAYIVRIPASEGRAPRRMAIPLPSDSSGIDHVLTACGRRTEDPRDSLPMADAFLLPGWEIGGFDYSGGRPTRESRILYSCILTAQGGVRDCQIDFERPADGGLGARLVARQGRARYEYDGPAEALDGRIIYMPQGFVRPVIVVERVEILR